MRAMEGKLADNHGLGAVEASLLSVRGADGDVQGCESFAWRRGEHLTVAEGLPKQVALGHALLQSWVEMAEWSVAAHRQTPGLLDHVQGAKPRVKEGKTDWRLSIINIPLCSKDEANSVRPSARAVPRTSALEIFPNTSPCLAPRLVPQVEPEGS